MEQNKKYEERLTANEINLVKYDEKEAQLDYRERRKRYYESLKNDMLELESLDKELSDDSNMTDNITWNFNNYNSVAASILGFIVGDALGVPVEFTSRAQRKTNPVTTMEGFGTHNMPKGTWSDDSSMVLATIASINECQGIDYKNIMDKYMEWYKNSDYTATNTLFDIGNTTARALMNYESGKKPANCGLKTRDSNGNGSLMRMLPVSLYMMYENYDEKKEVETVYYYSSLTHGHDISLMGCKLYSDILKELISKKNMKNAIEAIKTKDYNEYYYEPYQYNKILSGKILDMDEENIKSTGYVVDTLEAAVWCVLNTNNFKDAVLKAVNLGGDTDTIAAITGSMAGVLYGLESIPAEWINSLQNKELVFKSIEDFTKTLNNKEQNKSNEKNEGKKR